MIFANFQFGTIVSQIRGAVDESFAEMEERLFEMTESRSIL
jgi:hypothetical protein